MKLIDKAALVAEIERIRSILGNPFCLNDTAKASWVARKEVCEDILSFLDTLEVKEVDLETELNKWRHNHFHGRRDKDASGEYLERSSQLDIAEHFFNLGLISQDNKI